MIESSARMYKFVINLYTVLINNVESDIYIYIHSVTNERDEFNEKISSE